LPLVLAPPAHPARGLNISWDTARPTGYFADVERIANYSASGSEAALVHDAFLYRAVDEYVGAIMTFLRGNGAGRPPALVAVPGRQLALLRALLDDGLQPVTFADMDELGQNPARLTAAMRRFVERQDAIPLRLVTEAVRPGQPPAAYGEIVLHEAVLGQALFGSMASVLCPVDASACAPEVLEDVAQTHSYVVAAGERTTSLSYDSSLAAALFDRRLPGVPPASGRHAYHREGLADLRRFVEAGATQVGLPSEQVQDLVLAANEVATNSLVHAAGSGVMHLWADAETAEIVCDLCDDGCISELLSGRIAPALLARHGWGLWMVNQVCDLVEMRSGQWGTNIRLHMGLGPREEPAAPGVASP
jgi:anti-sigma regulatory factor (Ser/Thr protein kinase)